MTKADTRGCACPSGLIAPDFAAIEAAGLHQMGQRWCVWKLEARPGAKPAKRPYRDQVGESISSQKPEMWLPYEDAKRLFQGGGFSGIGYLPMPEDVIVGLDADGVLGSDGTVLDSALDIVAGLEAIGCYMERSPSGKGLRAFVRGIKDGKQKVNVHGHSVEAYQPDEDWQERGNKPQYLTITGSVWGDLRPAKAGEGAQQSLENFLLSVGLMESEGNGGGGEAIPDDFDSWERRTDDEVERLLLGSLNLAGKINRAWDGDDTVSGGRSESRGLVLKQLWYITRDAEQIRRVALRSKLDQTRFAERRNGHADFLGYEIHRARLRQKRNYDADRAAKREQADRAKALASALAVKAREVMGSAGIEDLKNAKGVLIESLHSATELLVRDARLAGVVWYNEFSGHVCKTVSLAEAFGDPCASKATGRFNDDDPLAIEVRMMSEWRLKITTNMAKAAARRWAMATSRNPVTEKLQALASAWDGKQRLHSWLVDYAGAVPKDQAQALYLAEVGKRFLIGVVARAYIPGVQQHQMLVLEGATAAGKSTLVRTLAMVIDEDAYLESFTLHDGKDCLLRLRGKVLGEWAELAGFGKRESESVKDFLSRGGDSYRDPYGFYDQTWPRTVSFIATTNDREYLRDPTGNRRYWPVLCGLIDLLGMQRDAGQIIGEAVTLYQAGARWWVEARDASDAEFSEACGREQSDRLVITAAGERAKDLADRVIHGQHVSGIGVAEVFQAFTAADMKSAMFPDVRVVSVPDWMAATEAMKVVGWVKGKDSAGNATWRLSDQKIKELYRLHELGIPPSLSREKPKRRNNT